MATGFWAEAPAFGRARGAARPPLRAAGDERFWPALAEVDRDAAAPVFLADAVRRVATTTHSTPRLESRAATTRRVGGWHARPGRSAHLARAHVGVRADQRVLLGEAFQTEVVRVDVGVAALAAGDQVGHELAHR